MHRRAFTLIELLVVIAIVAILAIVVVLVLNPAQLLMQARDSNRLSDLANVNSAIGYYLQDQTSPSLGNVSTNYISIPDPSATSTAGDQCQGLNMLSLGSSNWQCAPASTSRQTNSTGWIPVNFSAISVGSPLGQLPVDPINQTSTDLFYSYGTNGIQYALAAAMESSKYKTQFALNPLISGYPEVAANGNNVSLSPLWNASGLVGYWPLNEGTGMVANDLSSSGNSGTWTGSASGSSGYYSNGKVGPWAGNFNGVNDTIIAGTQSITSSISVAAWIYSSNFTQNGVIIEKNPVNTNWTFFFSAGGVIWRGGNTVQISCSVPSNNNWHYFAATQSGVTAKMYIDGISCASGTVTAMGNGTGTVEIGEYGGSSYPLNGLIDDVRLYNRVLGDAEIAALYNAEK